MPIAVKTMSIADGGLRTVLVLLSSLFAIEICRYAVMFSHIHLVIKLMPQEAESDSKVRNERHHTHDDEKADVKSTRCL
jgi:REP element-mobilizing transposase RayT